MLPAGVGYFVPLVETGKYVSLEEAKLIYSMCCLAELENAYHFVFTALFSWDLCFLETWKQILIL